MSLLIDKTIADYNNILASNEPAPGGGSTAALSGALGASLTMMVVNLSIGKKSYEALEKNIKNDITKNFKVIKSLNSELMQLVDEDTNAFNLFMAAMKMPKETEKEKEERADAMQEANKYALEVPLLAAEKCFLILKHQSVIAKYGNKNAVSDVGVGALLSFAGLEGAVLNVKINLPGIKESNGKKVVLEKIECYLTEGRKLKDEILGIVNKRILSR